MYWMIIHKQTFEVLSVIYYDHIEHMQERAENPLETRIRTYRSGEYVEIEPPEVIPEDRDPIGEVASFYARLHFLGRFFEDRLYELLGPDGSFFESFDESINAIRKLDKWIDEFETDPIEPALMPEDTSISVEQFKQTPIFQETERKLKKRVIQERNVARRERRKKRKLKK